MYLNSCDFRCMYALPYLTKGSLSIFEWKLDANIYDFFAPTSGDTCEDSIVYFFVSVVVLTVTKTVTKMALTVVLKFYKNSTVHDTYCMNLNQSCEKFPHFWELSIAPVEIVVFPKILGFFFLGREWSGIRTPFEKRKKYRQNKKNAESTR